MCNSSHLSFPPTSICLFEMAQREEVLVHQISFADVRQFASVTNSVFARDPGTALMFAYPCRKSEPEAYKSAVQKTDPLRQASMLRRYCEPTHYMVCAKVDNEVAGVAIWAPPKDRLRHVPLHLKFLRLVLSACDTITAFIYPNWLQKMINPAKHAELAERNERRSRIMDLDNEIRKDCVPSEMEEGTYWTLSVLGVSEEYGRRGIGTKLLQWGFDRADADDRPIFVSASQEGAALYKKNGFQVVHYASQILYDPIRGWMDQTYLVRWNRSKREGL